MPARRESTARPNPRLTPKKKGVTTCVATPCFLLARQEGFEPPTHGLEGRCSIRLSYWRADFFAGTVYRGRGEKARGMRGGGCWRSGQNRWRIGTLGEKSGTGPVPADLTDPCRRGGAENSTGQDRGGPAPDEAAMGCSAQMRRRRPTAANPARPVAKRSRVAGSGTGVILSVSARKVRVFAVVVEPTK